MYVEEICLSAAVADLDADQSPDDQKTAATLYRSHNRLVFYSQYGRVPLVILFNRSPDRATLDSFTDTLVYQIKDAKVHYPGANETLSEELKAHRHLMEEGVISSKRYNLVKQRILSQHS